MKLLLVFFTVLLLSIVLAHAPVEAAANLPQKAFNVEGGMISVSGGVMPNPEAPASLPIGKLKYPTRYFLKLVNESPYPIWLDAAWTFPNTNKDKAAKAKTVRGQKVPPNGNYWFYADKLGVIANQAIMIEIKAWSDEKRTQLSGSQMAELYFAQPDIDHFLANFPNPFKSQAGKDLEAVVISGWHDLPLARTDVPGTLSDARLQTDIQSSIWKADSQRRWSCEREVLHATPISIDESRILSRLPDEAQKQARRDQAENTLLAESWAVRSCGQELVYEVLLSASKTGGTDVMVFEASGLPSVPSGE